MIKKTLIILGISTLISGHAFALNSAANSDEQVIQLETIKGRATRQFTPPAFSRQQAIAAASKDGAVVKRIRYIKDHAGKNKRPPFYLIDVEKGGKVKRLAFSAVDGHVLPAKKSAHQPLPPHKKHKHKKHHHVWQRR